MQTRRPRTRRTFPVQVAMTKITTDCKPTWVRRIHAQGVHGQPAVGCTACRRLMITDGQA